MLDTVNEFERCAAGTGGEVTLLLDWRWTRTAYAGEDREVIVFPQLPAAVYSGSRLLSVFSHTADGATYSAVDGVGARRSVVTESYFATGG